MTINTKEGLTKVLNDIVGNRKALASQVEAAEIQIGVQKEQLNHFDIIIAAMKVQLKDKHGDLDADIQAELAAPDLREPVVPTPPLADAGANQAAAGSASADGAEGTDGNGSPVPGNPDPLA